MSYKQEFETVDLILASSAETRGVDAFSLALIKGERQVRKLVTHLVFQFPCFTGHDIGNLRETLGKNRRVYFEGFIRGFDALYPRTVEDLIGAGYTQLRDRIDKAVDFRNKIFHGQLTGEHLTREDLLGYVGEIRTWCESLANGACRELKYDGFARNSFQKSEIDDLSQRFNLPFAHVADYEAFIKKYLQRPPIRDRTEE